jgi:hypothetical protein
VDQKNEWMSPKVVYLSVDAASFLPVSGKRRAVAWLDLLVTASFAADRMDE